MAQRAKRKLIRLLINRQNSSGHSRTEARSNHAYCVGINYTDWKNMLAYKFGYTLYNQILPAERERLTNERSRINDNFYNDIVKFSTQAEGQDPPDWRYWFWGK